MTQAQDGTLRAEYRHDPVLLQESIDALDVMPGEVVVDCTLGGAGHSIEILRRLHGEGLLIGIDQDDSALAAANQRLSSQAVNTPYLTLKGNFGSLDILLQQAEVPGIDAILFDLGVSSPQLDFPERGFSYKEDAPLDMRMDPSKQILTAAQVINTYTEADLARILLTHADETFGKRIARLIVEEREKRFIETTLELVDIIKRAIPAKARQKAKHPARKTFQALRIEVNDEFGVLKRGLDAACRWLVPGGRIAVITYHSIEDRIVKRVFAEHAASLGVQAQDIPAGLALTEDQLIDIIDAKQPVLQLVTKKPILPQAGEIAVNPRARSAKLRVAQKNDYVDKKGR